jgi:hypothetical protein
VVAKAHSKATKLAATFLARLSSADVAAATFRVDVQTVRRWQAGGDAPPDDTWTAIRDVLLTRGAEMAAKGETSGLVQTLTAAGISDRNVRYSTLIARREQRREAEQQPEPDEREMFAEAARALRDDQTELLRCEIQAELAARAYERSISSTSDGNPTLPAEADVADNAAIMRFIAKIAALDEAGVAERLKIAQARMDAIEAEYYHETYGPSPGPEARKSEPPPAAPRPLRTVQPVSAPPAPTPMLVDVELLEAGEHLEDHPTWRPT